MIIEMNDCKCFAINYYTIYILSNYVFMIPAIMYS